MKIKKYFEVNKIKIPYLTETKDIRSFILKLDNYNNIIFSRPKNSTKEQIEIFLYNNFYKIYKKSLSRNSLSNAIDLKNNFFYCLGEKIDINYDFKNELFYINNKVKKLSNEKMINKIIEFQNETLLRYLEAKQYEFEEQFKMKHSKVLLSNKQKAWASNYVFQNKIIYSFNLAPFSRKTIDYVIVHELCHNIFQDHSNNFWNLVEQKFPNYLDAKEKLRKFIFN